MLYWAIQITVISIVFILVVHNIFYFLKNTLTVPKAKDLVDVHMEKYKHIYATLNKDTSDQITTNIQSTNGTTNIDDIPIMNQSNEADTAITIDKLLDTNQNSNMKSELKNFMKRQMNNKQPASTSEPQFMPL